MTADDLGAVVPRIPLRLQPLPELEPFHQPMLADKKVQTILVNIFAGINRCDWVAEGVIKAIREVGVNVPLVVRLAGTNVEEGRRILDQSGENVIVAETLEAAKARADMRQMAPITLSAVFFI